MSLNFNPALVPMPKYSFRLATAKRENHGMNRLGPRVHRGISMHRGVTGGQSFYNAVGYLLRSDVAGLTDGYIDNNTGEVVFMNPIAAMFPGELPSNWVDMAGWANGPYGGNPFNIANVAPDALAFRNKYGGRLGANIVNQDLESFEVLGNYDTPISAAAKRSIAQIFANRAQRKKIPHDSFPINPATGLTEMYGHREFCGTAYKLCPGSVVWEFINGELVLMVREILKKAQTTGVAAPAPKPTPAKPAPAPVHEAPLDLLAELFGNADGFSYDPNGVITAAWLDAGETSGEFPRLEDTIVDGKVRNFVFANGMVLQNEIGTAKVSRFSTAKG